MKKLFLTAIMLLTAAFTAMAEGVYEVYSESELVDALEKHNTKTDTIRIMKDISMGGFLQTVPSLTFHGVLTGEIREGEEGYNPLVDGKPEDGKFNMRKLMKMNNTLFKSLDGATIINIYFQNCKNTAANAKQSVAGGIATSSKNTTFSCLIFDKCELYCASHGGLIAGESVSDTIVSVFALNQCNVRVSEDEVGMFCGHASGTTFVACITDNSCTVRAESGWDGQVGGICGQAKQYNGRGCTFDGCINMAFVSGSDKGDQVGGICGVSNYSTFTDCYNAGHLAQINHATWLESKSTIVAVSATTGALTLTPLWSYASFMLCYSFKTYLRLNALYLEQEAAAAAHKIWYIYEPSIETFLGETGHFGTQAEAISLLKSQYLASNITLYASLVSVAAIAIETAYLVYTFQEPDEMGGIAGRAHGGSMLRCENYGMLRCLDDQCGGIVGLAMDGITIRDCANYGPIHADKQTGGIVGQLNSGCSVERCINAAVVYASEDLHSNNNIVGECNGSDRGHHVCISQTDSVYGSDFAMYMPFRMFKSGEVALYMNKLGGDSIWCQQIGTDIYPSPRRNGTCLILSEDQINTHLDPYVLVSNATEFCSAVSSSCFNRIKLTNDITLPSNTALLSLDHFPFRGSIDGQGHAIIGDGKECKVSDNGGLFGRFVNADIRNLTIRNFAMSGGDKVGILVGEAYDTKFSNITIEGSSRTYAEGKQTGAVCGYAERCEFDSCYVAASVKIYCDGPDAHDNALAGGICGQAFDTNFHYCTNNAEVEADDDRIAGIVADLCGGEIVSCVNNAHIHHHNWSGWTASCDEVGGIVAFANGITVDRCQNNGRVSCADEDAGGIVAKTYNTVTIKNCLNTAVVYTRNGSSAGSIVGNINSQSSAINCMATGHVEHDGDVVYAWCGGEEESGRTITNCYYRFDGQGNVTEEEMKNGALAWKLNAQTADGTPAWHQAIGLENLPSPVYSEKNTVYYFSNCYGDYVYTNSKPVAGETGAHVFVDRVCKYCGFSLDGVQPIYTVEDFMHFADNINKGYAQQNAELMADLDFTGHGFNAIGTADIPFTGTFNGNGHTIKLFFRKPDTDYEAPFRNVCGATIKNLRVDGSITTSGRYAAGIVAETTGDVQTNMENCVSGVTITSTYEGDAAHGGLIAVNNGKMLSISNCVFCGTMDLSNVTTGCGGLLGWNSANSILCTVSNTLQAGTFLNTTEATLGNLLARYEKSAPAYYATYRFSYIDSRLSSDFSPYDAQRGAITYLLNGKTSDDNVIWRQTIGTDAFPKLCLTDDEKQASGVVYYGSTCLAGDIYENTPFTIETQYQHTIVNGTCIKCGYAESGIRNIDSADDMIKYSNSVNNGAYQNAVLTADIDLSDIDYFLPLGSSNPFTGTFDGHGHTVTINLDEGTNDYSALFSKIQDAQIKNLRVAGTITTSGHYAAGIVGTVLGSSTQGGESHISNCASAVNIISTTDGQAFHAGIIARNQAKELYVNNCLFNGAMDLNGKTTACAGLIGTTDDNCLTEINGCLQMGSFNNVMDNDSVSTYSAGTRKPDVYSSYALCNVNGKTVIGNKINLASGRVTYILNGMTSSAGATWRQSLGVDGMPALCVTDLEKEQHGIVYVDQTCGDKPVYSNEPLALSDNHTYDDNNVCTVCGYEYGGIRHIYTLDDLVSFANFVNEGYSQDADLMNDIDATSITGSLFTGTYAAIFDGQGHTIKLNVSDSQASFFNVLRNAEVKNLCLVGTATVSGAPAGAFASVAEGDNVMLTNCVSNLSLTPVNQPCGGFIGSCQAGNVILYNCLNNGEINTASQTTDVVTSSFVGECNSTSTVNLSNCLQAGSITGAEQLIANALDKYIYDCYYVMLNDATPDQTSVIEQATVADLFSGKLATQLQWGQQLKYGNNAEGVTADTDLADLPSPMRSALTYSRTAINGQWTTLVLPFDFSVSDYASAMSFYTLRGLNDDEILLDQLTDTIPAGTPLIVAFNADAAEADNTYSMFIAAVNWNFDETPVPQGDTADELTLTGAYQTRTFDADERAYVLSGDKFSPVAAVKQMTPTADVTCPPYYAWIQPNYIPTSDLSLPASAPATAIGALLTDGAAPTATWQIYDVDGRRQSRLRTGVNIIRSANGQTRKVIVK